MKSFIITLVFLVTHSLIAQKTIKGKITDNNNLVLEGASVFLNNTTIGTISDENGEFELKAPSDNYTLVVYFLGFKTVEKLILSEEKEYLTIQLEEDNELLDEVELDISPKNNFKDFKRFKQAFIGNTDLAKGCEILNPDVLQYYLNSRTGKLTVRAKKPIQILNKKLGYKVYYDLVKLTIDHKSTSFHGYARYEKLKGKKRQEKRWKKNRLKAYNGSLLHFFRSLYMANVQEEGFVINQFKRQKIILKKGEKVKEVPLKDNLNYDDLVFRTNGKTYLNFNFWLEVIYKKEKEELNYRKFGKRLNQQESIIQMLEKPIEIFPSGKLANPLGTFTEQYWAYEKIADLLPTDYQPIK